MKLKIFSDKKYLLDADWIRPHPILHPFWLDKSNNSQYPWFNKHDNYIDIGHSLFDIVSLEEADFAVMPDNWKTVTGEVWSAQVNKQAEELYVQFAKLADQAKKPLIVFFGGARSDEDVPFKNAFIFRQSYYRSRQLKNNFVYPIFCEDLVKYYLGNDLKIRQKQAKPKVGFCGLIKRDTWKVKLKKNLYSLYRTIQGNPVIVPPAQGHVLRAQAIDTLSKSLLIEKNFVIRDSMVFLGKDDFEQMYKSRIDFVENIVSSDYVFCCRGAGNSSIRLFETLCCGRIPILVNTDCVLPYDFTIDWKKYCVWVEEKELHLIAEKVAEFHEKLSPQEFIDLQYECRKLWQEWLSSEGFFSKFYLHFSSNIQQNKEMIPEIVNPG